MALCLATSMLVGPGLGVAAANQPAAEQATERRGQNVTFENPEALEAFVDDLMAERVGESVPGATVAVVEGDETVLAKGYGYADAERERPVRANETTFRVGSVSKLVTWTAVMQGVEGGRLSLDTDVNRYLASSNATVPATYETPVTLRHLGTHTAGFGTAVNPGMVTEREAVTPLEPAVATGRPDRVRPPGETVAYSNYGSALAGHAVATAHNTTFEAYAQEEIFGPLGMTHSTFAQPVPDDHPGERAKPHRRTASGFEPVEPVYITWRPAGSMHTTATDMAAFMQAHLNGGAANGGRILQPDTVATMQDSHHERHPAVNDVRYGFFEYGPPEADLLAHSGATLHETSLLVLAPEDDVGIFVSYNVRTEADPPAAVVDEILDAYDLQPATAPPDGSTGVETRARAETVAGEYVATTRPETGPEQSLGLLLRLSVDATGDGRLVTSTPLPGTEDREWVETEPYVYRATDGQDVLAVEVENGSVAALHRNSQPQASYEPVPLWKHAAVVGWSLALALAAFALTVVGWVFRVLWRYSDEGGPSMEAPTDDETAALDALPASPDDLWSTPTLARAAAVGLSVVGLGFAGALVAGIVFGGGQLAFVTMPLALGVAYRLPWAAVVFAAGTVAGAVLAWRHAYWSRWGRIHQTALALLGVLFVWQLTVLGFLPG